MFNQEEEKPIEIENVDGFELVANALDVDGKRLYKEQVNKTSIIKDSQSSFMVENNYLQIKDYDSLDFDTGEVTNQLAQNEQKIKNLTISLFWEIEMSRDTCKKIYDTLCRNTDIIFRKLQNSELKLVKMIEQIGNYSFQDLFLLSLLNLQKQSKKLQNSSVLFLMQAN